MGQRKKENESRFQNNHMGTKLPLCEFSCLAEMLSWYEGFEIAFFFFKCFLSKEIKGLIHL